VLIFRWFVYRLRTLCVSGGVEICISLRFGDEFGDLV
jgi:hypothetical protein